MSDFTVTITGNLAKLQNYINTLSQRTEAFLNELAESGIPIIDTEIAQAQGDSDKTHSAYVTVENQGNIFVATLTAQGKDIAFLEFGAGIFYNAGNEHPKASEMGMGVGTYPNQTHAFEVGWRYLGADDRWHYSHGTEGRFPLYKALNHMQQTFFEVAKKHF